MDAQRQALDSFVRLHASKASARGDERIAHLVRHTAQGVALNVPLQQYTLEDIVREFDPDRPLVRWLIRQLQTYDISRESVIGLIFDGGQDPLAHVVYRGQIRNHAEDD